MNKPHPRNLIGIVSCHKHREFEDACRHTWIHDIPATVDYRFFLGNPRPTDVNHDEVFLDVDDGYHSLHFKTRAIIRWALEHGYEYFYKTDIDTLVHPVNLLNSGFEQHDYAGGLNDLCGPNVPSFASGGAGYWLSKRAMELVAVEPDNDIDCEDVYVSLVMIRNQIPLHNDPNYKFKPGDMLDKNTISYHLSSVFGWRGTYTPDMMRKYYQESKAL